MSYGWPSRWLGWKYGHMAPEQTVAYEPKSVRHGTLGGGAGERRGGGRWNAGAIPGTWFGQQLTGAMAAAGRHKTRAALLPYNILQ